jgi:putative endonuclease
MAAKDELGRRGEDLAALHLQRGGFDIVERNWRCPAGEIDIVARDGDEVVFVEVKTRTSTAYGHPLEAITVQKLARLRRLAGAWCEAHPVGAAGLRIDAVAVIAPRLGSPTIEHIRGVF